MQMTEQQVQEKRYWSHEETGREAGGLDATCGALQKALEEIEALPSRSGEYVGEPSVSDADMEALQEIMGRIDRAANYATDRAMQSYADYCEEQAAAMAEERE